MQQESTFNPGRYAQFYSAHTIKNNFFNGQVSLSDILKQGDFGIGTFNDVNGEMIVVDGVIYRLCADGSAVRIEDFREQTPYAALTYFKPDVATNSQQAMDMDETIQYLDSMISHEWDINAVMIAGKFTYMRTRAPLPQYPPYKDLATMIREQQQTEFHAIDGVMIGFYTPTYLEALGVPGYHFHFIDAARQHGGHVQDFTLSNATISVQRMREVLTFAPGGDMKHPAQQINS